MSGTDSALDMPAELLLLVRLYDFDERPLGDTTFKGYTRAQWQSARIQLGLDPNPMEVTEEEAEFITQEEEEAWYAKERELTAKAAEKQTRYLDKNGRDWIDECAETMTVDEFRGAMKFTIGKYVRRAGKKDEIQKEIRKIEDYAARWLEYERKLD